MDQKPTYEELEQRVEQLEESELQGKLAFEALRDSEIKHKTLVQNIPGIVYRAYADWSSEIISGSKAICGYTSNELNSMKDNWLSIIHPVDRESVLKKGNELPERKQSIVQSYRVITKSGEIRWVEDRKTSLFSETGEFIGIDGIVFDITKRKRAEEDLSRSVKEWQITFDTTNDVIWTLDTDHYILRSNRMTAKIFGINHQECIGKHCWEIVHGTEKPIPECPLLRARKTLKRESMELPMGDKWFEVVVDPIVEAGGRYTGAVHRISDITGRKASEEIIRRQQEELQTIIDSVPAYFFYKDRKGRHIYVNKALADQTGISKEYWIGKTIRELLPNLAEGYEIDDEEVMSLGQPKTNIIEPFETTAGIRWAQTDKIPIKNEKGDVIGLTASSIDITERVLAEAALKESEEKFRQLVENIDEIFWIRDSKTNELLYISPNFEDIWGISIKSVTDKPELFLESIHPSDRDRVISSFKNQERKESFELEYRIVKPDGTVRWVQGKNFPIYDESGKIYRRAGINEDITQKKQMENELIQSHKIKAIGALAGGIAHNFNNFLSSIIGFTELTLDEAKPGTIIEDNLQEIYSAGNRAKDLVQQMLTFAQETDEKIQPIEIKSIAKEVLHFLRSSIPSTIEIHQDLKSNTLIKANTAQIKQIFMNLSTNAAHAMDEDGGIMEISLKDVAIDKTSTLYKKGLKPGEYIEIKISDTGVGISPNHIDSIFEPYFTTKEPDEGTGMGLAVVQGIVEKSGGMITVESRLREGSIFSVYWPISEKRKDKLAYVSEKLPGGTERILFVDDEISIVKMSSRILGDLGYAVTARTSSIEALELFRSKPDDFDLVITDMTMPNMTGDKLAVELMNIRPDIPVILCTGYSKKIPDESAAEIGIRAFAYKPMVKTDLANTVRKVLDEAKG